MIDFNVLQKSKKESAEYYVQYGNEQLIPFFQALGVSSRNTETDKLAFNMMLYAIRHYEKFQAECNIEDKQKLLFSICRTVPFLSNTIISGSSVDGVVDKYAIRHKYGFEDNNIFRDLKYLQKITAYNKNPNSPLFYGAIKPEEIDGMLLDMLSPFKNIIMLELDETKADPDKAIERTQYLDVKQYPNIFTLAAFYREEQRLNDAKDILEIAVKILTEQAMVNPEKSLFVALRAITIVGEFSSQKNLVFQTRLNNPEFTKSLEIVKNITNDIVKPDRYDKFTSVIHHIDLNTLKQQLGLLLQGLNSLSLLSTDATYEEKVKYYTNSLVPKSPYLSAELITALNTFINTEFPGLDTDQKNRIEQLLSSDKNEKFITDILDICKPLKEHKKIIFAKYKGLISDVKGYIPPQDAPLLLHCGELEKLVSLLKDVIATKPIKDSAKDILSTLNDFLHSQVSVLPRPMQDDNSLKLELEQFKTGQTTTGGALIMKVKLPSDTIKSIKIEYDDSIASNIEIAVQSIKKYMGNQIVFPKSFFEKDEAFVTKTNVDLAKFEAYITSHTREVFEYIINYGRYCALCQFIKEDSNQQVLEFLLQTSYTLVKEAKEEDTDLVFPEIEYRALRHAIRHFEDNLDVMEVQTPIEEIYVHYAIRFLGEDPWLH